MSYWVKAIFLCSVLLFTPSLMANSLYPLQTNQQQEQFDNLLKELRCLVCQNQNLADSNADFAREMRQQVYSMVKEGQSSEEIKNYLSARYGDFILFKPPLIGVTALLWVAPFLFLLIGFFFFGRIFLNENKMLEWILIAVLLTCSFMAMALAIYPLRILGKKILVIPVVMVPFLLVIYSQCGSFQNWSTFVKKEEHQRQIKQILATFKNSDELIRQLQVKIKENPRNSRGWYLLGRLLASQDDFLQAKEAFAHAFDLKPHNERIAVNYVESLWQANQQVLDESTKEICQKILAQNKQQPDILSLLALDAYRSQNYPVAIEYCKNY